MARSVFISLLIITYFSYSPYAKAADFSFTGTFDHDDEHRNFTVVVSQPATVSVRTLSFGGGTNAKGATVVPGGFDPSISIFDSNGAMLAINRDAGCAGATPDPITLFCWDGRVDVPLIPGTYQVVLTESENVPLGPTIDAPFVYDGTGNFTASPKAGPSDGFWDYSLHQRTGSFSLDIRNVDAVTLGFVPNVTALVNSASYLNGLIAPNTALSYYAPNLPSGQLSVQINGVNASILYSGNGQVNFVVPEGVPVGSTVLLQVVRGNTLLLSTPVAAVASNPALFTAGAGTGPASALNENSSVNTATNPAARGSTIVLYGTGFGKALPPGTDGLQRLASGVTATIGGTQAEVIYAGLVPGSTPGLQQFNVRIPGNASVGAAVSVQLTIGGTATQAGTTISVLQ